MIREAAAYMNAHSDLLAELERRYPREDFSWMVDLAPRDEEGSEEETEREREDEQNDNVPGEQAGGDPPAE